MNYEKLTKNSGITKSVKKNLKRRFETEGLKIESGEQMERITDDVIAVPIKLTKKQWKKRIQSTIYVPPQIIAGTLSVS